MKHAGRLVGIDLARRGGRWRARVEYLRSALGEEAWVEGMHPEVPQAQLFDNPYQYTDYSSEQHAHVTRALTGAAPVPLAGQSGRSLPTHLQVIDRPACMRRSTGQ